MPSRPPRINKRPRAKAWRTTRKSRQARGYGRQHEIMREIVLREEPLCRMCLAEGRVTAATIADHIIPLSLGGSSDRDNYQGLDRECHRKKTAAESIAARSHK